MLTLITFIFFVLGLVIGSFLNVVIFRLHTRKSFGGRSACMSCQNQLSWFELIPVFSYIGLLGRCKNCKTKISIQYPLVETTIGIIFAILFIKFQDLFVTSVYGFAAAYAYYAVFFSLLVVVSVYDLKHKIIPDVLALVLGIISFLGLFFFGGSEAVPSFHLPTWLELASGPIMAAPFALLWLVSRGRWMGLGDAKLAISLGWLLGLASATSGVIIAFWMGAIVGIVLLVFSKKYRIKSEIPFAPYLALGAFIAYVFGLHLFTLL